MSALLVSECTVEPAPDELAAAARAIAAGGLRVERATIAAHTAQRLTAEGLAAGRSYSAREGKLVVRLAGYLPREPNAFDLFVAAKRGVPAEPVREPRYSVLTDGRTTGRATDVHTAAQRFVEMSRGAS